MNINLEGKLFEISPYPQVINFLWHPEMVKYDF